MLQLLEFTIGYPFRQQIVLITARLKTALEENRLESSFNRQ